MHHNKNIIISVFGPDGVGKSTLTRQLAQLGFNVFSGTGVASWPDQTWHNELVAAGIEDTTENNDTHFKEKIRRAHAMADKLALDSPVVIDSDPFHKTLMHDYLRSENTDLLNNRFDELSSYADLGADDSHIHLHLQISADSDPAQSAQLLQSRITARGNRAPFDPKTVEESKKMIIANRLIAAILQVHGHRVVTIATDSPTSIDQLTKTLGL